MSSGTLVATPVTTRKRRINVKLLAAATVLLLTVGFLVFNALGSSMAYFQTVSELRESGRDQTGERVRVGGDVVPGSVERTGLGDELRFTITDGAQTMDVVYDDVVPDIFKDGVEVVAEGHVGPDGTFVADSLLTKCPSRFEAEDQSATS
jgi:cytochrome c-type biogenesis protein CcmE